MNPNNSTPNVREESINLTMEEKWLAWCGLLVVIAVFFLGVIVGKLWK